MVTHAFNPSSQEAEAGSSQFQDNQGYTEKPCLEKSKTKQKINILVIKINLSVSLVFTSACVFKTRFLCVPALDNWNSLWPPWSTE